MTQRAYRETTTTDPQIITNKSMSDKAEAAGAAVRETKSPSTHTQKNDLEDIVIVEADDHEVFKAGTTGVQFRTLGWPIASVIFLKRAYSQF